MARPVSGRPRSIPNPMKNARAREGPGSLGRNVRLEGNKPYVSTNPQSNGIDGKVIVGELVWEKVK